jgi:tRNA nucleotidyltransferase/poly(A) polymerase
LNLNPDAEIRVVGGWVRDKLFENYHGYCHIPNDLDFVVTGIDLDTLAEALQKKKEEEYKKFSGKEPKKRTRK